jgi:hypothetical protein
VRAAIIWLLSEDVNLLTIRFPARMRAAVAAVVVALISVSAATASPSIKLGIYDDAQTLFSPSMAIPDYQTLGVQVLRIQLRWDQVAAAAPSGAPGDPASYPAANWRRYDDAIRQADAAGIRVFMTIYGTPSWANGGRSMVFAPSGLQLQSFARAAATRYGGGYDPPETPPGDVLPRVIYWGAWNEPNLHTFLRPQYTRVRGRWVSTAPRQYTRICNQVMNGVHSAQSTLPGELVACGITSPRGNNNPLAASPAHTPLQFLRGMKAAKAKFDVYGHQPHSPRKSPTWKPRTLHHIALGNISYLVKELTRLYGKKRLWITEYGYETNPPDPHLGVSPATQAAWLKQAFGIAKAHTRIDMFIWFLLYDEVDLNGGAFGVPGWQSGLRDRSGAAKPAYATFQSLTP